MGSSQTSSTNQTQTQTANPQTQQAVGSILSQVPGLATGANSQYNSAMNQNVAPLNSQQLSAISGLGGLQTNNPAAPFITQASQYSNLAADPNNINAMTEAFYNPMASKIFSQMENVFGQQGAQVLGNAAASGATGGSRAPIAAENLINQQDLALGQTAANLYGQAQNAAQNQQAQIAAQAYTQGNLGNEALNTNLTGINAALQGGNLTQQQLQNILNAQTANAYANALYTPQYLSQLGNLSGIGSLLGGTTTGQGTTTTPVNMFGQILGAGIAGYGLYSSDERVKENIQPIGKSFDKQTIYKFNYIGDPSPRIGLMAQEVEKKHPGAVKEINGTKAVDYNKATAKSVQLGEHRKPRAIGGGVGIGNGVSGLAGYSGLQNPMQQYFGSPQVNVPQAHFPTLNLNPTDPNAAQKQADQNAQQMMTLGKDLGKGHLGSDVNSGLGNLVFGSDATTSPGGWSTSTQPSGGFLGGLSDYFGYAQGGRIHRPYGGIVDDDPNSIQAANDAFLANNQGFGLGANIIPPAEAALAPSNPWQPSIEGISQKPIQDRLPPSSLATPVTMGSLSATPSSGQYYDLNDDGTHRGAPQTPPPVSDPTKFQDRLPASSPVQQASIASPAHAPQPTPPAPIAQPAQPASPLSPHGVVQNTIDTFRQGGASDNAIRGILVNYNDESGFNPGLRHPDQDPHKWFGESRYAHGLAQEGGAEWNRYASWLEQNGRHASDWSDPNLQNQFLLWNLQTNYPQVWDAMNNAPTAEASAQAFLRGYLRPSFANQERRAAQYERGIPGIDEFVNNAGTKGFSTRSVLSDPSLQPPKPGDSYLDRTLASFGMNLNQPQGLGGSLGRMLGTNPSMDPQTSNRLVNLGLGMMAAGPTVGVKGFPGAAINSLTNFGKGGQFALNQEQQERAQAINLANAAMQQKLHEAQIRHYNMESQKPFVAKTTAETVVDPTTGMVIGTKNINHYAQFDQNGNMHWVDEATNNALNGQPGTGATPSPKALPRLDAIQGTGDEFVNAAKQAGYSPLLVDEAEKVANYKSDPRQIATRSRHEQLLIDALAHRINENYEPQRYAGITAAQKALNAGNVKTALGRIGQLFDEVETAHRLSGETGNYDTWPAPETRNAIAGGLLPTTTYEAKRKALGTQINNVAASASAVAKGSGVPAQKEAEDRKKQLSVDAAPTALRSALVTEGETALKFGQTQLNGINEAKGILQSPEDKNYRSIMSLMSASQQQKAIKILGQEKIEEITHRPLAMDLRPVNKEQYANLKSGDYFVAEDDPGNVRIKP